MPRNIQKINSEKILREVSRAAKESVENTFYEVYTSIARIMGAEIPNFDTFSLSPIDPKTSEKWDILFRSVPRDEIKQMLRDGSLLRQITRTIRSGEVTLPIFPDVIKGLLGDIPVGNVLNVYSGYGSAGRNIQDYYGISEFCSVEADSRKLWVQEITNNILGNKMKYINSNFLNLAIDEKYDFIFGEPQFGFQIQNRNRDKFSKDNRFTPMSSIGYAVVDKAFENLRHNGKAAFLVAPSSLFSLRDRDYRKYLVDNHKIEMIVMLPKDMLEYAPVSPALLIVSNSYNDNVKIADFSSWGLTGRTNIEKRSKDFLKYFFDSLKQPETFMILTAEMIKQNDYLLDPVAYFSSNGLKDFQQTALVGDLATIFRGKNTIIKDDGEGCFIVGAKAFNDQRIDLNEMREVSDQPGRFNDLYLKDGDILIFTKAVGIAIAKIDNIENRKVIPSNNIIVVRSNPEKLNPSYLMAYLSSSDGIKRLETIKRGTPIANILTPDLKKLSIPITDLENQEVLGNRYEIMQDRIFKTKKDLELLNEKRNLLFEESGESLGIR